MFNLSNCEKTVNLCSFLKVPMPLCLVWLSHPAKEVIFNLTIYPIKTSIWQECFNCPEWVRQRKSVFIKRVSMVELLDRG